jgi:hypothetical protein
MSYAQEALWLLELLEPVGGAYNERIGLRIRGPLDVAGFDHAFRAVVQRHESLRTRFAGGDDGRGRQIIDDDVTVPVEVVDLSAVDDADRDERARALAQLAAARPFDLATGPLWRVTLIRLAAHDHILVVTMHHIVSDGWTLSLLLDEIGMFYAAYSRGQRLTLESPQLQYADYAAWQRQWMDGERLEQQLAYWRTHLAGVSAVLPLPTDRPRPATQTYRGARRSLVIGKEIAAAVKALSGRAGVTPYVTLLAAVQMLIARWTGHTDIAVGSPVAGRRLRQTETIAGLFVNTVVMRTDLSGNPSFTELLGRARAVALDAYAHQDVPFEKVAAELSPVRDGARQPLFQVMLVLQNQPMPGWRWSELDVGAMEIERGAAKFDVSIHLVETAEGFVGFMEYATDLFELTTIDRLAESFTELLTNVTCQSERPIFESPLRTTMEHDRDLAALASAFAAPLDDPDTGRDGRVAVAAAR